jgi:hypothetical protein
MSLDKEEQLLETWMPTVVQAIRGLRYGSVEVKVHEGRVVQVERRERVRLDEAGRRPDHRWRGNHDRRADRTSGGFEAARAEETER